MRKNISRSDNSPLLYAKRLRQSNIVNGFIAVVSFCIHVSFALNVATFLPRILESDQSAVNSFVQICFILAITKASSTFLSELLNAKSYAKLHGELAEEIIISSVNIKNTETKKSQICNVLTSGLNALENYIRYYVPAFINALIIPFLCILAIFFVDPISALIICATVGLVPLFMILIGKHSRDITQSQWDGLRNVRDSFAHLIEGITTLRMFSQEKRADKYIEKVSNRYRVTLMKTLRVAFLSAFALEAIATLSVAIVAVTLGVRLVDSNVSLHDALFVLFVIPECYWPLRKLGAAYHAAEMGKDAAKDIAEFLSQKDSEFIESNSFNKICFNNLETDSNFSTHLNFRAGEFNKGEFKAIVGENGTGKSTLLRILRKDQDFIGDIFCDDINISDISTKHWNEEFTYVSQDCVIYGNNVRSAISFSNTIDENILQEITEKLSITELLDISVDKLSGGQRQRVAIAHAIYKLLTTNAWLFLADEPSAHLDDANTVHVLNLLKELSNDGYCIVVATHDELVINSADNILNLGSKINNEIEIENDKTLDSGENSASHDIQNVDTNKETLSLFGRVVKKVVTRTISAVCMASFVDIASLALAATSLWLIVRAGEHPQFSELVFASLCVRIFGISKAVGRYGERLTTHRTALEIVSKLRVMTVKHLTKIMPDNFPEATKGNTLNRIIDDHDAAQDLFIRSIVPAASTLLTGLVTVGCLMFYSIDSALVVLVGVFIGSIAIPAFGAYSYKKIGKALGNTEENYASEIYKFGDSSEIILTKNDLNYVLSCVKSTLSKRHNSMLKAGNTAALLSALSSSLGLAIVGFNVAIVKNETNASGPVFAIVLLFSFSIMTIFESNSRAGEFFYQGSFAWSRIKEILDRQSAIIDPKTGIDLKGSSIVLQDASFIWDENGKGCRNISLTIDSTNNKLVISGPSGSGKSTLAAGLVRFLEINTGQYFIDKHDVHKTISDEVRKIIMWQTQDPWLAPGTIRDNMLLAKADVTDEEIKSVFAILSGTNIINDVDGIDKNISLGANNFSKGEQCKIALARTLLSAHTIKIFDEPSASLDLESSLNFHKYLDGSNKNYSQILLTHEIDDNLKESNIISL